MTTNSPNPVDGDVQALTEKERIEQVKVVSSLIEKIVSDCANGWTAERDYLLPLQIALAALTAEPVAQTSDIFMRELKINKSVNCWLVAPDSDPGFTVRLYTTPPAQLLRPVELPKSQRLDGNGYGYYFDMDDVFRALEKSGVPFKSQG